MKSNERKRLKQLIKIRLLAERAGINQSTLSRILHNRQNVSPELAAKLAKIVNQLVPKEERQRPFRAKDFL